MLNFSNFLVFGTHNPVQLNEKSSNSNNFEQELVRSCNLPTRKRRAKKLLLEPISVFDLILFKFEVELYHQVMSLIN